MAVKVEFVRARVIVALGAVHNSVPVGRWRVVSLDFVIRLGFFTPGLSRSAVCMTVFIHCYGHHVFPGVN